MLLIGFFSAGLLSNLFTGGSRSVTIPFRALVLLLSIIIIVSGILNNRFTIPLRELIFFLLFWIFYMGRLVIDLYFRNIQAVVFESNLEYFLNAIGICFIPCLSILFVKEINLDWILKWTFRILLISLIVSVFLNLSLDTEESQQSYGRYGGGGGLNTINYGHQGVTLSLLSLFLLLRTKDLLKAIIYVFSFLVGLFIMYLSGSKSPLLALLLCSSFYFFSRQGLLKGLITLMLILCPFFIFSSEIVDFLSQYGGSFLDRVAVAMKSGDQGRNNLFSEGINEFANSPIWGSSFVLQGRGAGYWSGFHPHNIIIESLMALGLIGGVLILCIIGKGIYFAYKLASKSSPDAWSGIILLQYSILAMFSNAIYTNHTFWYYSILILMSKPYLKVINTPVAKTVNNSIDHSKQSSLSHY